MKKKIFFIAVVLLVVNLIWLPYNTIVLENKNLKYIQKIILPNGTNFMQTILLEQNSWVFYIKTNTTLDKYVVPLTEVPTK